VEHWGEQEAYRIPKGKPEGKRPLGRPRSKWVDNRKTDLIESISGVDWIRLVQDKDKLGARVNTVMSTGVPQIPGKFLSSCSTDGISREDFISSVTTEVEIRRFILKKMFS
jgi:hypothetical protein